MSPDITEKFTNELDNTLVNAGKKQVNLDSSKLIFSKPKIEKLNTLIIEEEKILTLKMEVQQIEDYQKYHKKIISKKEIDIKGKEEEIEVKKVKTIIEKVKILEIKIEDNTFLFIIIIICIFFFFIIMGLYKVVQNKNKRLGLLESRLTDIMGNNNNSGFPINMSYHDMISVRDDNMIVV